mgnify:CR=1 FL=1
MLTEKETGLKMTQLNNGVYEGPLDADGFPAPETIQVSTLEEPEFGPLRSEYKGISKEIEEAIPETEKKSNVYTGPVDSNGFPVDGADVYEGPTDELGFPVGEKPEEEVKEKTRPMYYRGAPLPPEIAKEAAEDLQAFGRDVPRMLTKVSKNLTTSILNSWAPAGLMDTINNLPPKQRNEALNKATEQALSYTIPLLGTVDWDNPETVDPETGRIRSYESDGALAVDMGAFMYFGNKLGVATGIAKAGIKNAPKLSSLAQEIVGYGAVGTVLLDSDERLANVIEDAIVDPEDPDSEYLGKSVVDFFAANPDDTVTEKQLKIALETASLAVVIRAVVAIVPPIYSAGKQAISATGKKADKILTKPRQLIMGKRPEELTKEEADAAFMKYMSEQRQRDNVLDIDTLEETAEGINQVQRQSGEGKTLLGKTDAFLYRQSQRFFTSRGLKTPLLYEAAQNARYNQKQLITAAQDTANRMRNAYNLTGGNKANIEKTKVLIETDLSDVFAMEATEQAAFLAKRENISEDLALEILIARQSVDELSQKALNITGFTDEAYESIQNNLGVYLRDSYEIFENAGFSVDSQLKEIARASVSRSLVQKAVSKAEDAGKTLSAKQMDTVVKNADTKARMEIDELLDDTGPITDFVAQSARVGKFYQKNKNLSPEIKAVLGEIEDPGERLILSIQKAARIVEMQNYYNTTLKLGNGNYIFNRGTAGQQAVGANGKLKYPTQIKNTNSVLDDMYTTPQIAEALANKEATFRFVEADNVASEIYRYYVASKGFTQSMKTVYSLSTNVRNVVGSYQFGVANGRILSQAGGNAARVIGNRLNKTLTLKERRQVYDELYQEYQGLGIINTQTNISQYREMMEESFESLAKRRKQLKEATSDIPVIGKAVQKLDKAVSDVAGSSAGNAVLRKPAEIYTATDDLFKIGSYEDELRTLKEAFPNADQDMLKRQAATTVKNTLPNYDKVPNSFKALGKTPIGNFIAFPAEIVRTSGHIVKQSVQEIRSSNSVIRKRGLQRLTGFATANVGFYGIAKGSQMALNMSDQEVEDRKLLSSGPWSAGHDMVFNKDVKTGKMYGLNTQYLNSYYTVQAPFRTGMDTYEDGILKGDKWDTIAVDVIYDALYEISQPYITESIATGPIKSLISGWWNETGKDSEGMQVRDDKSGYLWGNILGKFYEAFEPGFFTKTASMMNAINKVPSDYDQSYRDPYYEAWNQVGFNWDEQDLERDTANHVRNFKVLQRKNKLDYIRISTEVEDVVEDIFKTNAIEFQHQQDLYVYIQTARRLLKNDASVIAILKEEGYSRSNAIRMLKGQFTPQESAGRLKDKHMKEILNLSSADSIKFQNKLDEIETAAKDIYLSLDMLPLDKPFDAGRERKLQFDIETDQSFLLPKATGGVVSEPVANAPIEPDERIDKLTGLPYNERAGMAYMDIEDPLRALNMAAGGRVQKNAGSLLKTGIKIFTKSADDIVKQADRVVDDVVKAPVKLDDVLTDLRNAVKDTAETATPVRPVPPKQLDVENKAYDPRVSQALKDQGVDVPEKLKSGGEYVDPRTNEPLTNRVVSDAVISPFAQSRPVFQGTLKEYSSSKALLNSVKNKAAKKNPDVLVLKSNLLKSEKYKIISEDVEGLKNHTDSFGIVTVKGKSSEAYKKERGMVTDHMYGLQVRAKGDAILERTISKDPRDRYGYQQPSLKPHFVGDMRQGNKVGEVKIGTKTHPLYDVIYINSEYLERTAKAEGGEMTVDEGVFISDIYALDALGDNTREAKNAGGKVLSALKRNCN